MQRDFNVNIAQNYIYMSANKIISTDYQHRNVIIDP